jgi:beta-N-acetylhexosaminidase
MTPAQRAGQLLMVGLKPTMSSRALAAQVRAEGIGAVIYLGGWYSGTASVATVSARLQAAAGGHLLIAADQEGGAVQQLRGPGFSSIPSARAQGTTGTATEQGNARLWSLQLLRAGVNVNLAPVADTVPTSLGAANQPIGRFDRDFSRGAAVTNSRYAAAFVKGTLAGGIAPTVKHFPGLGRVTGNTDTTSEGITDSTTSATDPYLAPFEAAIASGAPLVMVSSGFYPRLDPANQAVFSSAVVTGLLRQRLRFGGVVISDDVGLSESVARVPVGQRATRFVAAGGDIVLTTAASQAPVMLGAIAARRAVSPAFAARVDAAAAKVLDLKARLRLVRCS